jgi:gluconate 2-dehydrogenase gamma chain
MILNREQLSFVTDLPDDVAGDSVSTDRRRFIRNALLAIGVAGVAFPGWASLEAAGHGEATFFDARRSAMLDAVAETMIPRTDTPGARDAGVPRRFDLLMQHWASAQTKSDFTRVLDEIDAAAKGIVALTPVKQLEVVAAYDRANMKNPAYIKFKGLILSLYYLSEPGALQELRYEHVPGAWEPSIPVTADTRGWAVDIQFG